MSYRSSISAAALALVLCLPIAGAKAQDAKKYPAWEGMWKRGSPVGVWDPTKPPGARQEPPLTPEYQAIFEANLAKGKAGVQFDIKGTCGPVGMPRLMILYEPMEIVIKPNGDGFYDTLEVETRDMRGPRLFDSTGIPLASDNETVVKEKIYLDKTDRDILRNEITTFDHALTRPWTVSRFYRREHNPIYEEYPCTEDNRWVAIGGELYLADSDGYLMPIQKNQQAPDVKYLQKYFNQPKK